MITFRFRRVVSRTVRSTRETISSQVAVVLSFVDFGTMDSALETAEAALVSGLIAPNVLEDCQTEHEDDDDFTWVISDLSTANSSNGTFSLRW